MNFLPAVGLERKVLEEFVDSGAQDQYAEAIAEAARELAPVLTGTYRDSIHVEDGKVVADAPHAAAVEGGTNDTPAFAPLRRGAETIVGTDGMRSR